MPATCWPATPCDATNSPRPPTLAGYLVESHTGPTEYTATVASVRGARSGVGIVEGWRGTIVHRVEIDGDARITRVQDRRPVLVQLARAAGRHGRHHRPGLPADQQKLQPVLRRQRPVTDNGADSCWATTRLGANGYRCCSRDALRDNSAANTSPAFFASRKSSCQTTFSVPSDTKAASSSEPPASVGLACRSVGAWRRHLVKRIHCKTDNRQARQPFDLTGGVSHHRRRSRHVQKGGGMPR